MTNKKTFLTLCRLSTTPPEVFHEHQLRPSFHRVILLGTWGERTKLHLYAPKQIDNPGGLRRIHDNVKLQNAMRKYIRWLKEWQAQQKPQESQ